MKKVLIITYYWPPAGGAPVQRWLKLTKYLHRIGIEPIVVTVDDSYGGYPITDNTLNAEVLPNQRVYRTKTWEPFEIYRKLSGKKKLPATSFIDDQTPSFTEKVMRFIRGNLFIPDARVGWNKYAFKKCCEIIDTEKIDVIITSSPPHSSQLIGLKLKKKYNLTWIADFRDPWTDIHYYDLMYHTLLAKKIDAGYELNVMKNADTVLVVSDGMEELLSKKYPTYTHKVKVIANGFDPEDFQVPSTPSETSFVITHTGSISEHFNIENFIETLSKVMKKHPEVPVTFKFVGIISKGLVGLFAKYNIAIETVNYIPHKEVAKLLKASTVLFLTIIPNAKNKGIISAKFFEYLAAEKPIICLAPTDSDVARIIAECNAGKTIDYNDTLQFEKYIESLFNAWKENKNLNLTDQTYQMYSRKAQAEVLSQLITS